MKFDSPASVTLTNQSFARIRTNFAGNNEEIHIRFFYPHEGISMNVRGSYNTSVVPYMTYLNINTMDYCKNAKVGFLDRYIQGYQDHVETQPVHNTGSCGRRKIGYTQLILNGEVAQPGDWPWHVALYRLEGNSARYICGGTLISKLYVLTAAHCTTVRGSPILPEVLSVVLGKYNLIGGDIGAEERKVHSIQVHEDYKPRYLHNDISLLKLSSEVTFSDYIQPACLWQKGDYKILPDNQIIGTVVGWGFDQNDQLTSKLNKAVLPMLTEGECIKKNLVLYGTILNDKKFCAGYGNGTSACNGDSGGGFHIFVPDSPKDATPNATGSWHVRGIVSVTARRADAAICDPYQYTVFTDIEKFRDWIEQRIN